MTNWRPTQKQRAVLEAATEVGLRRSITAVCEESGVTRAAFYKWLDTSPEFSAAWDEVWHGTIRRHMPTVAMAMLERAQSGDVSAARLLADMAGVIKQNINQQHSGEVVMKVVHERADRPHS